MSDDRIKIPTHFILAIGVLIFCAGAFVQHIGQLIAEPYLTGYVLIAWSINMTVLWLIKERNKS